MEERTITEWVDLLSSKVPDAALFGGPLLPIQSASVISAFKQVPVSIRRAVFIGFKQELDDRRKNYNVS
jgi:hypothetical protein